MAISTKERVQVIVEVKDDRTGRVVFRDALYLTPEERAALGDQDLAARGQARYSAWLADREATKAAPVPTKEQNEADLEVVRQQKAELEAREAELVAKLAPADGGVKVDSGTRVK